MPNELRRDTTVQADKLGLILDSTSFVPYYEQIVDRVRNLIKENKLQEGDEGECARCARCARLG